MQAPCNWTEALACPQLARWKSWIGSLLQGMHYFTTTWGGLMKYSMKHAVKTVLKRVPKGS